MDRPRDPAPERPAGPGAAATAARGRPRVLVVDDRLASREVLTVALAALGLEVSEASGGEEGLRRVLSEPYDLVLLDIVMPDLDGFEVLRAIRERFSELERPVIVLPALDDSRTVVKALRLGANDTVAKPLDIPQLVARVQTQLRRKETEGRGCGAPDPAAPGGGGRAPELAAVNAALTREIEERKRIERRLRESEARYRAIYDQNPAMFYTLDREGLVVSANDFGAAQLGYSVHELLGLRLLDLQPPPERAVGSNHLEACLDEPGMVRRWETRLARRDDSTIWVRASAKAIDDDEDIRLLLVCEDVTDAHELSQQLTHQASHDPLTGLVNRREFESRLARVLGTARGGDDEHALCYLDLDQFKVVNDTCGHVAGDELLRRLGVLLAEKVRRRDTLARLGGDEFAVLMEHCGIDQAQRVANELRGAIGEFRYQWEGQTFTLGVSIGVVPITRHSESVAEVMRAADSACYVAKDGGRNRIHVYRENDEQLARRHGEMQWVVQIQRALDEDRFLLEFMPMVALRLAEAAPRYELLLRMRDERGTVIPPGAFLPAAERYNLCSQIDRWVVRTGLRWLADHPAHLQELGLCSMNLSGRSLGDDQFLVYLDRELRSHRIAPSKIGFEIPESAAVAHLAEATRFVKVLREWGCQVALDDFGRGLSSFAYLKSLPVDCLKIDGIFVKDILEDPLDLAMVKSFNHIGRVTGKETVAEFVETPAIMERIRAIGIDYAQGYAVGRPRPLDELLDG